MYKFFLINKTIGIVTIDEDFIHVDRDSFCDN